MGVMSLRPVLRLPLLILAMSIPSEAAARRGRLPPRQSPFATR